MLSRVSTPTYAQSGVYTNTCSIERLHQHMFNRVSIPTHAQSNVYTNTWRFCFNILQSGISSESQIFQRSITTILEGQRGVICHVDDILIHGTNKPEHDRRVRAVLRRLHQAGLTPNNKCEFSKQSVKFLGHVIDVSVIHADSIKTAATAQLAAPTDVSVIHADSIKTAATAQFPAPTDVSVINADSIKTAATAQLAAPTDVSVIHADSIKTAATAQFPAPTDVSVIHVDSIKTAATAQFPAPTDVSVIHADSIKTAATAQFPAPTDVSVIHVDSIKTAATAQFPAPTDVSVIHADSIKTAAAAQLAAPTDVSVIHADNIKTAATAQFPAPTDVTELQRFTGMVNQMGKLIPGRAELNTPCWFQEPDIATRLIRRRHLSRVGCVDYTSKHTFYTWRLEIDDVFHFSGERSKYYMQYVAETNVFVGFKSADSVEGTCRSCFKRSLVASTSPIRCQSKDDDICQCPCHGALEFHYCRNTFPHREDGLPVCSPVGQEANFRFVPCIAEHRHNMTTIHRTAEVILIAVRCYYLSYCCVDGVYSSPMPNEGEVAATLPRCYTSVCSNITDNGACLAAVGCIWYHVLSRDAECIDMEEAKTRTTPSVEATHTTTDTDTPVTDVTYVADATLVGGVTTVASVTPVANDVTPVANDATPAEWHNNMAVIIAPVVGFVIIVGIIAVVLIKRRRTPVTDFIFQGTAHSNACSTTSSIIGFHGSNPAHDPDRSAVAFHAAHPGIGFHPDVPPSPSTDRPSYVAAVRGFNDGFNCDPV
ncbi:hypothetical protein LSAT2_005653 [Lamellibrachia satsuma]|nr:hypothetical protein LSAT2_005653 [Lamellibrachia satsuma]